MKYVVYFHGFASSPNSSKVKELGKKYQVFAPNVPYSTDGIQKLENEISNWMENTVKPGDQIVFVGTSLGGYWASVMAYKFDGIAVVFNPSVDPSKDLQKFIGKNTNYLTGEEFDLTAADVNSFCCLTKNAKSATYLAVISDKDSVVSPTRAAEFYNNVVTLDSDDHRFENTELMLQYIDEAFENMNDFDFCNGDFE